MGFVLSTEEEWFQSVIQQLTPKFSEFAKTSVKRSVEPSVRKSLKESEKGEKKPPGIDFEFTETDFGTIPPKISNIKTHKEDDGQANSIVIDFDFNYEGDSNIQVTIMGLRSGVCDLAISGRARIVLKPTTSLSPPFFGGIQFCFLDELKIFFDLTGLADIGDWAFFRRKIQEAILKDISTRCVFPNKVVIPTSSVNPMLIKGFDPKGILAVKINSAAGLPKKGGFRGGLRSIIKQDKPDAYVIVKVGSYECKTAVIKNTKEPVWSEPWFHFLMERAEGHNIRLMMYDEDSLSKDDFLGKIVINMDDHLQSLHEAGPEGIELSLGLEDDEMEKEKNKTISGDVSISMKWMELKPLSYLESDPQVAVVKIFLYSCNNLVEMIDGTVPNGEEEGIPGEIIVDAQLKDIKKSTEVIKNTPHPNFEHGFTFKVENLEEWQSNAVTLTALDNITGGSFGTLDLNMGELAENPLGRKVFSLNPEKPMVTITVSASVLFA